MENRKGEKEMQLIVLLKQTFELKIDPLLTLRKKNLFIHRFLFVHNNQQ